jgi:hypothetical protein
MRFASCSRKRLLGVAERLAGHNLDVWKQAGPYVQTVLVQKIHAMDRTNIDPSGRFSSRSSAMPSRSRFMA